MDNDVDPKRIVTMLEDISSYAEKDVFSNSNEFYDAFSKMKMIVDYMASEKIVEKLKKAWLKQETSRFLENLSHAEELAQFKKSTDDYLSILSGRVAESKGRHNEVILSDIIKYAEKITPIDLMFKKEEAEKYLNQVEIIPSTLERLNRFKKEYRLSCLEELAEFYNKIKNGNDLFYIVSNIDDNLESILNFSYKKENDEAKLAEDYFKFMTLHKNWTESPKNSIFKEFEKERKELEKSKGTAKMINELKEICSTYADKNKPAVKNAIDYLESSAYIDDLVNFTNYKDNFEKRINIWKEVKGKITNSESYPYIADKIRIMCLEVANEKIYNSVRNLNEKLKNNGFSSKNEIKGIYVDAIEGITDIITGELGYMATGERRYRK